MTKVEQLQKFIIDNGLQFTEGRRNNDCVILCGYAQYLKVPYEDLKKVIPKNVQTSELGEELARVWVYAEANHYGKWWENEANRKVYKL